MVEKVAQLTLQFDGNLAELLANDTSRSRLEREILPAYIQQCRWYRSKTRKLSKVFFEAWTSLPAEPQKSASWFAVIKVSFEEGEPERYALPLSSLPQGDAMYDVNFRAALFKISMEGTQATLGDGILKGAPFSIQETELDPNFSSQLVGGEQSNTAFIFSTGHFLKLYRHLEEGFHPEPEILRFLKEVRYPHVPVFRASLEWQRLNHPAITVAMIQDRIETHGNAWEYLTNRLASLLPEVQSREPVIQPIEVPDDLAAWTRLLGSRTAGLHLALGSRYDAAAFAPEPFVVEDLTAVRSTTTHLLNGAIGISEGRSPEDREVIQKSLAALARMETFLSKTASSGLGNKIRTHGDLHLGQILCVREDICFIDFEGEPARPLSEKRRKHSPLRDVAGMLRSFHYAAHVAHRPDNLAVALGELFLEGYHGLLGNSDLLPQDVIVRDALLNFFVLEKAVYELHYELNNRPDWAEIPLRGLIDLIREEELPG